jgi:hypothetical protein
VVGADEHREVVGLVEVDWVAVGVQHVVVVDPVLSRAGEDDRTHRPSIILMTVRRDRSAITSRSHRDAGAVDERVDDEAVEPRERDGDKWSEDDILAT